MRRKTPLPFMGFLSSDQLKAVDRTSRGILARIGIAVEDDETLDRLEKSGARVDRVRARVRLPGPWLDKTLAQAPRRFSLHSRDGQNDLHLGQGSVYFAGGGRVFRLLDAKTGSYRLTRLEDVARTAALVDHLTNIRLYIIACQAHDIGESFYHLNDFYHAFNHTTKHVMGGCDTRQGVEQMWALACTIAGGEDALREKPFVSVITNPISPLTIDGGTLSILEFCATRGIPVTCAPAPISGATAPATLAGTLAQMHAEALAGVALAQVFAPGARVLYGAVPSAMDLRDMAYAMGSVEAAIMNAAAVQLSKRYDLPIYASAGMTESKRPDIQAGSEKSFSNLMVALSGADLIHLAAGMLDSGNSISFEQYVIDNELIGMVHRVLRGVSVDSDSLGFDVIEKVGPGGHFVLEDHTVAHMIEEFFYPRLSIRENYDIWAQNRKPDMLERARGLVEKFFNNGLRPQLPPEVIEKIHRSLPGIESI